MKETSIGQGQSQFPSTCWDALSRITKHEGGIDEVNRLTERYWRPVYRFIRSVWKKSVEDAKDLTQEFFATVFDRDFLLTADASRGNFRQFVLSSLRNFLSNDHRGAKAQKRGGDVAILPLVVGAEEESFDPADPADPEKAFDEAWAAEILRRALERLESDYAAAGHSRRFEAFQSYCTDASYKDIAGQLGVGEREVDYFLVAARRDLRKLCVQIVRETVQDPAQIEEEMARLFGRMT